MAAWLRSCAPWSRLRIVLVWRRSWPIATAPRSMGRGLGSSWHRLIAWWSPRWPGGPGSAGRRCGAGNGALKAAWMACCTMPAASRAKRPWPTAFEQAGLAPPAHHRNGMTGLRRPPLWPIAARRLPFRPPRVRDTGWSPKTGGDRKAEMAFSTSYPDAARRDLSFADVLSNGDRARRTVAGYLYGLAAECALKQLGSGSLAVTQGANDGDHPLMAHFPELKTLLRDHLQGRMKAELRRFVENDRSMHHWDILYCSPFSKRLLRELRG